VVTEGEVVEEVEEEGVAEGVVVEERGGGGGGKVLISAHQGLVLVFKVKWCTLKCRVN